MNNMPAIQAAYQENDQAYRVAESKIGCIVALILVPAGISLDYFVYPEFFGFFSIMRIACNVIVALILILHFTSLGKNHIRLLTFAWLITIQLMISYMIFQTNGYESTYYAGLNLPLLAVGILLPTSIQENISFCGITIVIYLVACFSYQGNIADSSILYNNLYFIVLSSIISTTAVFFNSRRRFTEFRLNYELDVRNKELAELDKMKSQFFANISHELRTPLTLILAPIQDLLQKKNQLSSKAIKFLDTARNNALRLLKLVNDLLDVVRLEEGKMEIEQRPIELGKVLYGIIESVTHLAKTQHITLSTNLEAKPMVVRGDLHALEKIFLNLLSNSIKFTKSGGTISVKNYQNGENIFIEVQDTGIGISEEDLPHVFDRFQQVDGSSTRKYQGTGLGLALVKELTEKHGGNVSVKSSHGTGTTITVMLPVCNEVPIVSNDELSSIKSSVDTIDTIHHESELAIEHSLNKPLPSLPSNTIRSDGLPLVLVIDDEPDMRNYLISTLSDDFQLIQAQDGLQGLGLAQEYQPDLILLDLMLPEMDGLEVCNQIKQNAKLQHIKIMLLTARIDETAKITALEYGADDFLTKPFSSVEVKTRLRNLLQTAQLQKDLQQRNNDLKQTLVKLKGTQAQLIQSEKLNALGNLSAGLLHEINNPLNYTMTALQVAQNEISAQGDESLHEIFYDIGDGMQRIQTIVSDLRAFAYPSEADKQIIFEFSSALDNALRFTAYESRDLLIERELEPDCVITGSKTHIVQILVNLLTNSINAVKSILYLRQGKIRITCERADSRLQVHVWDNGEGIASENIPRVFDPFFTTREVGQGMGLGLSVCHTIASNHGGTLQVRSEKDKWTEFTFDLPLATETTCLTTG